MPRFASAGGELVDPRGEQLMAFRIVERAHGAFQTPAVSEVMVHRGPFLLVRVAPVAFAAPGGDAGAFLLEAFPVPHRQHPSAGIAELADHVRGAALVSDVQVHGPVALLLAVLRHKGVLLPVGESKKTSPPRLERATNSLSLIAYPLRAKDFARRSKLRYTEKVVPDVAYAFPFFCYVMSGLLRFGWSLRFLVPRSDMW